MQRPRLTTRFNYLDNGSCILIVFIVMLYHLPIHCRLGGSTIFIGIRNIVDFFMAWFFFKSGMLHKERTPKEELQKCWQRLLFPYLVINTCCLLLHILFLGADSSILEIIKVAGYNEVEDLCYPLWFLLSLAIVRLVYQFITNKSSINEWVISCFALSFAFLMYLYSYKLGNDSVIKSILPVTIPYWFGNVFLGLFFYALGDLLREKQFNRYVFVGALLLYVVHLFFPVFLNVWYNLSDLYLLSVLYYVAGIMVFNNVLSRWLDKRIPLMTHIGENSMVYYIIHGTFFELLFVVPIFNTSGGLISTIGLGSVTGWPLYIGTFLLSILFLSLMDFLFRKTKLRTMIGR